jgi:hypothetical protein
MFSLRIVTNITSASGTLHCSKTRIPFGDQLVICGLYFLLIFRLILSSVSKSLKWYFPLKRYD